MVRRLFIWLIICFLFVHPAHAVTEFVCKLCGTDSSNCTDEDFNTLDDWEAAVDGYDIRHTGSVKCGDWDGQSGSNIADGTAVTWDGGSSGGTLVHMTTNSAQYMIDVTSGTLADDDTVSDGTNTFDVNGAPDSCALVAEIYDDDGPLSDDRFTVDGTTTDTDNNIIFRAADGEEHTGTAGTGARVLHLPDDNYDRAFKLDDKHILIEWLEIQMDDENTTADYYLSAINYSQDDGELIIRNNIIYATGMDDANDEWGGIMVSSNGVNSDIYIYNNIIYGFDDDTGSDNGRGIHVKNNDPRSLTSYIYNNTVYNCDYGIYDLCMRPDLNRGNITMKNNISMDNDQADYATYVGGDECYDVQVYDYNISSDGTASGANSTTGESSSTYFVSTTTGSEDFHLVSGAGAVDDGADLGTGNEVEIDIDGRDRDSEGDTWDIGADEFVDDTPPASRRIFTITKNLNLMSWLSEILGQL